MRFKVFFLLLPLLFWTQALTAKLYLVDSFSQIQRHLKPFESEDLVVLDVDEVLMTDQDAILAPEADQLKRNLFNHYLEKAQTDLEQEKTLKMLSIPYLKSKKLPVEKEFSSWIDSLKKQGVKVIALTSYPTKGFGYIEDGVKERQKHLRAVQIHLSDPFQLKKNQYVELPLSSKKMARPIYHEGILFANGHSKAEVLAHFLKMVRYKPRKIIFIDNMIQNVLNMEEKLNRLNLEHDCFQYRYTEKYPHSKVDAKLAEKQFEYLFETGIWLSDQEMREKI